jgi:hypothetical protein
MRIKDEGEDPERMCIYSERDLACLKTFGKELYRPGVEN